MGDSHLRQMAGHRGWGWGSNESLEEEPWWLPSRGVVSWSSRWQLFLLLLPTSCRCLARGGGGGNGSLLVLAAM